MLWLLLMAALTGGLAATLTSCDDGVRCGESCEEDGDCLGRHICAFGAICMPEECSLCIEGGLGCNYTGGTEDEPLCEYQNCY